MTSAAVHSKAIDLLFIVAPIVLALLLFGPCLLCSTECPSVTCNYAVLSCQPRVTVTEYFVYNC